MNRGSLGAALDLLRDPTLLVEDSGEIVFANRAAVRYLKRSQEQLTKLSIMALVEDPSRVPPLMDRWARTRDLSPGVLRFSMEAELREVRCDGALFTLRDGDQRALLLLQLRDKSRAVGPFTELNQRVEALTREIGRRIEVERQLADQREWFRVTLTSIGDGVIATDDAGAIVFMNSAAERFTGWSAEQATGRPLDEVFVISNEQTGETMEAPVRRVLREGLVVGLANHTVLTRRDGARLAIADSAAPILGTNGEVRGVVLVFQDETTRRFNEATRKELYRREREARERAETVSRLKDEFLATLSHELRTPLTSILGWSEFLAREGRSSHKLEHALEVIRRNARDQVRLVDELLDVARITSGRLELEIVDVDLARIAQHAVDAVRHAAEAKGVVLELSVMDGAVRTRGDPMRLQQAIWNLISNALKFTPRGRHVRVSVSAVASKALVRVTDEGIGIAPEDVPRLFEPFWQSDARRVGRQRGLGLGLSIVSRIAEAHGGDVDVRSAGHDQGAQFTLRLPTSAVSRPTLQADSASSDASRHQIAGVRLLIVEDEPDSREMLVELMTLHGAEVRAAADAGEALSLLERWIPDAILSDISMPGMDGFEFIRAVRSRSTTPAASVPAIALTAFASPEYRQKSVQAGFQRHVVKPIDPAELARIVGELVGIERE